MDRRTLLKNMGATAAALALRPLRVDAAKPSFKLRYILASCMYGTTDVEEVLGEVHKTGAAHIDIWPKRHADQREQMDAMGLDRFEELLAKYKVGLGMLTRYDLGPFGQAEELKVAKRFGAKIIITGSRGPKGLKGAELKSAVQEFSEKMKPHVAEAEENDVILGIENHGLSLVDSPDSMKWLVEQIPSKHIGIALAPYHLPQDPKLIAKLIKELGPRLVHFYGWEHGAGNQEKLPKEQELLQMPGRGKLDFKPIIAALAKIGYQGWTEIFMHPVPRGIPILETTAEVTEEINRARAYLDECAEWIAWR